MATTANFGWPLPALTDVPNGPVQIAALGNAQDTSLNGFFKPRIKRVQRTGAGQAITDSTFTAVTGFNATTIQIGAAISHSAGVFTVDFVGAVEVSLYLIWPTIATAHRTLARILLNGNQTDDGLNTAWYPSGTGGQTAQKVISQTPCAVGDTFSSQVWQDSGSSQTTVTDGAFLTIRRIA